MSELSHSTGRAFVESISSIVSGNESTETRRADVVRIDPDGTVWVRSHGSDGQMPCTKSSVSCETGDTVLISIRPNGRASIEGNYTHPATDDSKADAALDRGSAAQQTADLAHLLAVWAISDAYAAKSAAGRAEADATRAASAAESAGQSALAAASSADSAASDAASAASNAGLAASSAQSAASDAASANESANAALTQLGTVEDVMGTLAWIHDHEVYVPATEYVAGETYYVLVDGKYVLVDSPTASEVANYYVYDHQATMAGFVQEHLTLTERGLYITQSKPTIYQLGDKDYISYGQALGTAQTGVDYYIKDDSDEYILLDHMPTSDEMRDCYVVTGNKSGEIRPQACGYLAITGDGVEVYDKSGLMVAKYGESTCIKGGEFSVNIDSDSFSVDRDYIVQDLVDNFGDTHPGKHLVKNVLFSCGMGEDGVKEVRFDDSRMKVSEDGFSYFSKGKERPEGRISNPGSIKVNNSGGVILKNNDLIFRIVDSEMKVLVNHHYTSGPLAQHNVQDILSVGVDDEGKRHLRFSKSDNYSDMLNDIPPSQHERVDMLDVDEDALTCNVDAAFNGDVTFTDAVIRKLFLAFHPPGSYWFSDDPTSPAVLFGGTWEQVTGKFLRMANDTDTGGSDFVTLTAEQMPKHSHGTGSAGGHEHTANSAGAHAHYVDVRTTANESSGYGLTKTQGFQNRAIVDCGQSDGGRRSALSAGAHTHKTTNNGAHTHTVTDSGGGKPFDNRPKYQDVYAWRRTA